MREAGSVAGHTAACRRRHGHASRWREARCKPDGRATPAGAGAHRRAWIPGARRRVVETSKGNKAHEGWGAATPATDGRDLEPDAEQGLGVEPTPEMAPANDTKARATETWRGCGGESSKGVERCGDGHRWCSPDSLLSGGGPGRRQTHRTPRPEPGCNKPGHLEDADRRSGEKPHGRPARRRGSRRRRRALGRFGNADVPRDRRWRGTLANPRS